MSTTKNDVYSIITQRMIDALLKGTVPWQKQWATSGSSGMACNFVSRKKYRGINAILTNYSEFSSPYWLTYNQAKDLGGQVRKGEKSTPIVFWSKCKNKDETKKDFMFAKYFSAFNTDQVDGLKMPDVVKPVTNEFTPIEKCEKIVSEFKDSPDIFHGEPRAYYRPSADNVNMPFRNSFINNEAYYSVLFHELTHSTGHSKRLNREGVTNIQRFGSHSYSREELIAEMGASFLCGHSGIDSTFDNSVAYIQSWLNVLKGDSKLIMQAASAAQKASDYILGIVPEVFTE